MKYSLIFMALALFGAVHAQLPIRNYIFLGQDSIVGLLEGEGLEYELNDPAMYEDSYGYGYDYEDEAVYYEDSVYYEDNAEEEFRVKDDELGGRADTAGAREVEISVISSGEDGYTGNDAFFFLRNDTCYLIQYNWYNDPFVLESIREVMDFREDFSPCFDMKDCWVQQKPGEETVYYWNLFDKYESDESWKALRIEADKDFEANRWWYQFAEGKY